MSFIRFLAPVLLALPATGFAAAPFSGSVEANYFGGRINGQSIDSEGGRLAVTANLKRDLELMLDYSDRTLDVGSSFGTGLNSKFDLDWRFYSAGLRLGSGPLTILPVMTVFGGISYERGDFEGPTKVQGGTQTPPSQPKDREHLEGFGLHVGLSLLVWEKVRLVGSYKHIQYDENDKEIFLSRNEPEANVSRLDAVLPLGEYTIPGFALTAAYQIYDKGDQELREQFIGARLEF